MRGSESVCKVFEEGESDGERRSGKEESLKFEEWEGSLKCEWVSETKWERWRTRGTRTHIKLVGGCPPGTKIEFVRLIFHLNKIEFVRLIFHLNKIESRGLEFISTKSSPKNSSSMPMWTKCPLQRLPRWENQVNYTRFMTPKLSLLLSSC